MCFFGLSMVGLTVYGLFLDFQLLGVLVFYHLFNSSWECLWLYERWFWMIMKICDFWCFEASGFLTFKESRLNYDNWPWFFCFFFYITWCLWSVVRALFEESRYFLYMIIGLFFHQSGSLQTISDSVSGLV